MFISLDYEFSRSKEEKVRVFSLVTHKFDIVVSNRKLTIVPYETKRFWLLDDLWEQDAAADYLRENSDCTLVGFSYVAEGRSHISIGLNPMDFKCIDLHLEWRCITNHNNAMATGKHLVGGKEKYIPIPKPKWERREGEKGASKLTHSLAECTFKLTGQKRDTEEKDQIRDYIISDPEFVPDEMREKILNYNEEDVVYLPEILVKVLEQYSKLLGTKYRREQILKEMENRGRYAALTSIRESKGYPINVTHVRNFTKAVDFILEEVQREINNLFPEIMPFKWQRKDQRFSWNQKATRKWLVDNGYSEKWMLTDTYDRDKKRLPKGEKLPVDDYLSLSLEAFQDKFPFKHTYPEDNFGAQMVRYLVLKQNLNGFKTKSEQGRKNFWDSVGSDGRVRPYMNIFGAQSSRSQPAATGFMFLKPAWMRVMVSPPKGKALAGIDFGSEEFFISALLSRDQNMIDAYLSGDVYLYFAKLAGAVPMDGVREDYEPQRDLFKSTVLGISYLMTKYGLAVKLTQDTGIFHTPDDAQKLIDKFYKVFSTFAKWQEEDIENYLDGNEVKLNDGWYMWRDNINFRSAANVRIQGAGAVIMRESDIRAYQQGIYVPFTLHDALYVEYDLEDFSAIDKLANSMRDAFVAYFPKDLKEYAEQIKLDINAWSEEYEEGKVITTPEGRKVKLTKKYIDKRARAYYEKYRYYLENDIFEF